MVFHPLPGFHKKEHCQCLLPGESILELVWKWSFPFFDFSEKCPQALNLETLLQILKEDRSLCTPFSHSSVGQAPQLHYISHELSISTFVEPLRDIMIVLGPGISGKYSASKEPWYRKELGNKALKQWIVLFFQHVRSLAFWPRPFFLWKICSEKIYLE